MMRSERIFSPAGNWDGGFYELDLVFEAGSVETLRAALTKFWSQSKLQGCFAERFPEPSLQTRVSPIVAGGILDQEWYGVATMPNGTRIACGSRVSAGSDLLPKIVFYLPMGALGRAYPVGAYPFADGSSLAWRDEVDTWLVEFGRAVHAEQPFRFGIIGHEVSVVIDTKDLVEVPQERSEGYLWPEGSELRWHRPTHGAPVMLGMPLDVDSANRLKKNLGGRLHRSLPAAFHRLVRGRGTDD